MATQTEKSQLETICKECGKLKKQHDKFVPSIIEKDLCKGEEIKAKQIALKKDYIRTVIEVYDAVKIQCPVVAGQYTTPVLNRIHGCYTICEQNIRS